MVTWSTVLQWMKEQGIFVVFIYRYYVNYDNCGTAVAATSFPGSLFSASLGRWKKDPGCGWSHDHPESGWQKNLLGGKGGRVFCLVDVTNFVGFKSSPSSR